MLKQKNTDDITGILPGNAALAMAYVPMQRSAYPSYDAMEALSKGTLFPGLNLPFMGMVNKTLASCPLTEIMSIDFVADELELYLDTHSEDMEAFSMYQTFLSLSKEARERYTALYGPIAQCDMLGAEKYTWLTDPWPWDYCEKLEG